MRLTGTDCKAYLSTCNLVIYVEQNACCELSLRAEILVLRFISSRTMCKISLRYAADVTSMPLMGKEKREAEGRCEASPLGNTLPCLVVYNCNLSHKGSKRINH